MKIQKPFLFAFLLILSAGMIMGLSGDQTESEKKAPQGKSTGQPDYGDKMNYSQLPDENGWAVMAVYPNLVADDWACYEPGLIKGIRFWGAWLDDNTGDIDSFSIKIYSDVPADPPSIPYGHPGDLLWEKEISTIIANPMPYSPHQGWYYPATSEFDSDNHRLYFQYDVNLLEADWFIQEPFTIYWLLITAHVDNPVETKWGWLSSIDYGYDNAVWKTSDWYELYAPPSFEDIMDMSFIVADSIFDDTCSLQNPGDFNYDGNINVGDMVNLLAYLVDDGLPPLVPANADANTDCCISLLDFYFLNESIFGGGPDPDSCTCVNPTPCQCTIGDANDDNEVNVGDAVFLINYTFKGGPAPQALCNGDANSDCTINIGDAVYIVNYAFKGGPSPNDCCLWIDICGPL